MPRERHFIVPLQQSAASRLAGVFDLRFVTGSHYTTFFLFIMWNPCKVLKGEAIHIQTVTTMIVISLHPTEELKLIKYQKELVRCLFSPGALIYAHQPLWIPTTFTSIQKAKDNITGVTLTGVEYDEKEERVICPVKISTIGGDYLESKLDFIHRLPRHSVPRNDGAFSAPGNSSHCERSAAIHINNDLFPLPLKIFRLGECTSPSPGVYELSNVVWKKL